MKKKLLRIGLPVLIAFIVTGCWDSTELNDRAFITAIGIDKGEGKGKMNVTLQIINPAAIGKKKEGGSGEEKVRIESLSGNTMSDILKKFKLETSTVPALFMTRVVVISEEAAKDGIVPLLDFSFRNEELPVRSFLLITKGKAIDVVRWKSQRKDIPADYIANMLKTEPYFSTTMSENIHEFVIKFTEKTTSPVTSGIEIAKGEERDKARISETAAFKGDKFAGWLNLYETKGLQWILDKYGKGIIEVEDNADDQSKMGMRLIKSHTRLDPEVINGRIIMHVEVKGEGEIWQSERTLTSQDVLRSLESKLNHEVNKEVEACLNKVQKKLKTDILGFGEEIHRKEPEAWKKVQRRWEQVFPDIEVKVDTDIKIMSTGFTIDPIR